MKAIMTVLMTKAVLLAAVIGASGGWAQEAAGQPETPQPGPFPFTGGSQTTTTSKVQLDVIETMGRSGGGSTGIAEGFFDLKGEAWDRAARAELVQFLVRVRGYWIGDPKIQFTIAPGGEVDSSVPFNFLITTNSRNHGIRGDLWVSEFKLALRELAMKEAAGVDVEQELKKIKERRGVMKLDDRIKYLAQRENTEPSPALTSRQVQLEAAVTEKKARRMALQMAVAEETESQALRKKDDVIAAQLRKLVELREKQLKTLQSQVAAGVGSTVEVQSAEAAAAEANLRLLEREEAISKTGKGELIDKLSTELRMTAVDQSQMEIELQMVQERILKEVEGARESQATAQTIVAKFDKEKADLNRRLVLLLLSQGGW